MKLYTEEQIRTALYLSSNCPLATNCEVLNQLTPIELPSDEEIEKKVNEISWIHPFYQSGFFNGIKWMKEQILNQNK